MVSQKMMAFFSKFWLLVSPDDPRPPLFAPNFVGLNFLINFAETGHSNFRPKFSTVAQK